MRFLEEAFEKLKARARTSRARQEQAICGTLVRSSRKSCPTGELSMVTI